MSTDIVSLEKRIQAIEDKQAITELKYRYFQGLDHRKPDEVREIFDPKGVIIDFGEWGRFDDREEFVKVFIAEECRPEVIDTHHGHNIIITLTGENTATGRIDLYHAQARPDLRTFTIEGAWYEEEYVRHSGRWWIKKLVFRILSEVSYKVAENGTLSVVKLGV